MKAILEFNLNEPEDIMAHKRCVKALDMSIALLQISNHLIEELKHIQEIAPDAEINMVEFISEFISSALEANGIMLDELIN
jgi:hypothetical protein